MGERRLRLCHRCGYDLDGAGHDDVCPECATPFDPGAAPSAGEDWQHLVVAFVLNGVVFAVGLGVVGPLWGAFEALVARATVPLWVVSPVVGLMMTTRAARRLRADGVLPIRGRRRLFYHAILPALAPPLATVFAVVVELVR